MVALGGTLKPALTEYSVVRDLSKETVAVADTLAKTQAEPSTVAETLPPHLTVSLLRDVQVALLRPCRVSFSTKLL